jgi:hypothetical protein
MLDRAILHPAVTILHIKGHVWTFWSNQVHALQVFKYSK